MSVVPFTGSRRSGRELGLASERSLGSDFRGGKSRFGSLGLSEDFFGDDDLFGDSFRSSRGIFSQMDRMMGAMMRDPFADDPFFRGSSFPTIPSIMGSGANDGHSMRSPFALSPFGSMMSSLESMTREGNCHSFSSSSVMTMTTGPDGKPQAPLIMQKSDSKSSSWREHSTRGMQVYQASSSTRGAPNGIRETRRSVADSSSGVRKMAIGHHINDRSHTIEKEMGRDGNLEERQELINLDEEEAPHFDKEFQRLSQQTFGGAAAIEHRPLHRSDHRSTSSPSRQRSTYLSALPASSSYRRRTRPMLALTSGSSRTEDRPRHRPKGAGRIRNNHHN